MKKETSIKNLVIYDAGFDLIQPGTIMSNGVAERCPRCLSTRALKNGGIKLLCSECGKQWSRRNR